MIRLSSWLYSRSVNRDDIEIEARVREWEKNEHWSVVVEVAKDAIVLRRSDVVHWCHLLPELDVQPSVLQRENDEDEEVNDEMRDEWLVLLTNLDADVVDALSHSFVEVSYGSSLLWGEVELVIGDDQRSVEDGPKVALERPRVEVRVHLV